jgi:cytoskeletal protein CcmA (bactofilin family)
MAPSSPSPSPTSVGADAEFEGILSGKDAQILGKFKGEILVTGKLSIGEGAKVDAKVTADTVEIAGAFKGELSTRALILLDKARVDGSVEVKSLSVRDGALLNAAVNVAGAGHASHAQAAAAARGAATG